MTHLVLHIVEKAADHIKPKCRDSAMFGAIYSGRIDLITALHSSGAEIRSGTRLSRALERASANGNISIFQYLLNTNSRYRSTTISYLGQSLYHAIHGGHHQIMEILLTAGADVCGPFETYLTPLSAAVERKDKNLVRRLLRAGATVNSTYYNAPNRVYVRASVLPAVVRWGDHSLILEIIKAGADVNATEGIEPRTALVIAADKGDVTSVNILINAGADFNHYEVGNSALTAAILKNNAFIAQNLLTFGADPDESAIMAAISVSQELLKMVLKARLSRYNRFSQGYGCWALQLAIKLKKTAVIEMLLASGVDPDTIVRPEIGSSYTSGIVYGESALGIAIEIAAGSDDSVVHQLLMSGANPNGIVTENPRYTALHKAILHGRLSIVEELINVGASVNGDASTAISRTPLQLAVEKGHINIVQLLLDHGAEVNAPPFYRHGATALQLAAIRGYARIAQLLFERGAEVNAPGAEIEGRTALEGAAEHGRIDMLQLLLNHGVDITRRGDNQYDRAKEFASENGHMAARRFLESWSV